MVGGGAWGRSSRHKQQRADDGGDEAEAVCETVEDFLEDVVAWNGGRKGGRAGKWVV